jgi:stage V sporulation protein B
MGASGWLGYWIINHMTPHYSKLMIVLTTTGAIIVTYVLLLIILGLVTRDELKRIPWIGLPLSKFAFK